MQALQIEQFNSVIVATIAGLVVGTITKIVNKSFDRKKDEFEQHVTLRKELREELDAVRDELHILQKELDEWKQKYYHQLELTNSLKLDIVKLTEEVEEYKRISGIYPSNDNGWTKREDYLK